MAKKKTILKSQEETELILKEKTISFGLEVRGLTVIHCLYKLANIHRFSMCDFCTVIKTQTLFHPYWTWIPVGLFYPQNFH
jgi:hypothetical protein